jgi:hypothetical protein
MGELLETLVIRVIIISKSNNFKELIPEFEIRSESKLECPFEFTITKIVLNFKVMNINRFWDELIHIIYKIVNFLPNYKNVINFIEYLN